MSPPEAHKRAEFAFMGGEGAGAADDVEGRGSLSGRATMVLKGHAVRGGVGAPVRV